MQKEAPIVTFSQVVKKIRAEGFTWKKIPLQAVSEKKNSCKLKIPPPPPTYHFSNGPSLWLVRFYTWPRDFHGDFSDVGPGDVVWCDAFEKPWGEYLVPEEAKMAVVLAY